METAALVAKYEARVPRYTSYPTAVQFGPSVGPEAYEAWLRALPRESRLSLYFHVPYCRRMCWFCACHTNIVRRDEPVAAYLALLRREIETVSGILGRRLPVGHIHWGGGTPTILAPDDLADLVALLGERFAIDEDAEHAVEIDPRTVTGDHIGAMAAAGVTRASLGVQDFDAHVQAAINRVQPEALTAGIVDALRQAGIEGLSFDLMYGLPRQTVPGVASTAARAAALAPDRISLFGYAHVPWMKRHQRMIDEQALPGPAERLAQFEAAAETLESAGYVAIGLDHFARPEDSLARAARSGRLHRNFQGYTTDDAEALLGFGASAIGRLPQGYVQNEPGIAAYRARIDRGRLATARGVALDDDDRLRAEIIERLMCDFAVDIDTVACRHGVKGGRFTSAFERLRPMVEDGLVMIEGGRVRMAPGRERFVRAVSAAFDRYLAAGETRHSTAI